MPPHKIISRLSLALVFKKGIFMRIRLSAFSNNHILGEPDTDLPTEQQKSNAFLSPACPVEDPYDFGTR